MNARRRSPRNRWAPDDIAARAALLALEHGVSLVLYADGSVAITGRLDTPGQQTVRNGDRELAPDEALARWEAEHGDTRHA